MSQTFDLVVVGAGLAGVTAALAAAEAGAKVALCDAGQGATTHWSGMGHLFGPLAAPPTTDGFTTTRSGRRFGSAERMAALLQSSPTHPYALLGWGADEVQRRAERALRLLQLEATIAARAVTLPSCEGVLRAADLVATGTMTTGLGAPTFAAPSGLRSCSAPWLAALWRDAGLGEADALTFATQRRYESLVAAAADLSRLSAAEWTTLLAGAPGDGPLVLPPLLGTTFAAAAALRAELSQALSRPVLEMVCGGEPVWGLRLRNLLDNACAAAPIARFGTVAAVPQPRDGAWSLRSGADDLSSPRLILATGAAAWRGSAAISPRWVRAAAGAVDGSHAAPWLPQPFAMRGLQTDRRLAVLGEVGLYACGGALAGHDSARDQTAFGLATATGIEAAVRALEATPA